MGSRSFVAFGVLDDARARQQRRHRRGAAAAATGIAAVVLGLVGAGGIGGSTRSPSAELPHPAVALVSCITVPSSWESGSPTPAFLSVLGVLRRPATAADPLPVQLRQTLGGGLVVYIKYVRRARVLSDRSYYVIPVRVGCGPAKAADEILLGCVLRSGPSIIDGGFGGEATPVQVDHGGAFLVGGSCLHTNQATLIAGVVPDRVASVTLRYPSITITAPVIDNVVVASVPHPGAPLWRPISMTWRATDGRVIKTFSTL